MENLDISSFNIAFFQEPKPPPSDEVFSNILSLVLRHFPIPGQISPLIITARRKQGGGLGVNPAFIQFVNLETKNFTQDMGMVKEIAQYYFTTFETKQVNQLAIRLASIRKANYLDDIRQLMKWKEFCIALKNLICIWRIFHSRWENHLFRILLKRRTPPCQNFQ